ncbi:Matrixin [Sporotomaculum syntrophicum]|uniref:Matrixin n=2 Tax=Sporotomaculum syntrophicum TaxID=182264 RepID=A0A9D3AXT4_9FIRM|nr:Matrixin [Sporotomaculum syntrophicum]
MIAALVVTFAFVGTSEALMINLSMDELSSAADSIVTGEVVEQSSQWDDGHAHIFTRVTLSIDESIKGDLAQGKLNITVPGGEVDGIIETVSDTPVFNAGEKVTVFLKKGKEDFRVYGGTQGKFNIKNGKVGKLTVEEFKAQVRQSLTGQAAPELESNKNLETFSGPLITGITPGSASAGTNSQVTVRGSGFGSTPGLVGFFYKMVTSDSYYYITGEIQSWSDLEIIVTVPVGIIDGYPASAGSGPVFVRTAGGLDSNDYPFSVPFSYLGRKWPGTNPVVNYKVNPNTSDCTGEETSIKNAADTWNSVHGANFNLEYAGTTNTTQSSFNNTNEIMWGTFTSSYIIAEASTWYANGNPLECDIKFNDYYSWSSASSLLSWQMDVETVALHELGHWAGLRDLYGNLSGYPLDVDKVMYGFCSNGVVKRDLHSGDEIGIQWIYPGSNNTFSVSGRVTGVQDNESGIPGVTMTFTSVSGDGQVPDTVSTDSGGYWEQTGFIISSAYRLTPAKQDYNFIPAYLEFDSQTGTLNFTGSPVPVVTVPRLQTDDATNVTSSSAVINGSILSNGGGAVSEYGFMWGTTQSTGDSAQTGSDDYLGNYSKTLSNLVPGTYYYKAYAKNSAGLGCGEIKSFTIDQGMLQGDVNGDNQVNVLDVVMTVNIVLGKVTPSDGQFDAADVNGDGGVNVIDVVKIVNLMLGKAN